MYGFGPIPPPPMPMYMMCEREAAMRSGGAARELAKAVLASREASPVNQIFPEARPRITSLAEAWALIQGEITNEKDDEVPELLSELYTFKAHVESFRKRLADANTSALQKQHDEAYAVCRDLETNVRDAALEYSRSQGGFNASGEYVLLAQRKYDEDVAKAAPKTDYPTAGEIEAYERAVAEAHGPVAEAEARRAHAEQYMNQCEAEYGRLQREFIAAQNREADLKARLNGAPPREMGFYPAGSR